jgi:signal transduction histidine kinase
VSSDHPYGFAIEVHVDGVLGDLPAAVEVAAFRIAIEAVSIAARCPGGRQCVVALRRGNDFFLDVSDDGRDRDSCRSVADVDLRSMREWAVELGGECTIEANRDRAGCTVSVRLPLPGSAST